MTESYHGKSCALLFISQQLLTSGLSEVLAQSSFSSITAQDLCRKVAFCVQASWTRTVKHSLEKLLEKCPDNSQHSAGGTAFNGCSSLYTTPLSNLVTNGLHGRQLTSICPLRKGDKVGEDIPYLLTPIVACGCCEGSLMVEHVTIAIALFLHRQQRRQQQKKQQVQGSSDSSSGKQEQDHVTDLLFDDFLQSVRGAGFDSTPKATSSVSSSSSSSSSSSNSVLNAHNDSRDSSCSINGPLSSDSTIPLMAVVAAISVCYLNDRHTTSLATATKVLTATSTTASMPATASTPAVAKDVTSQYQADCWMFFQILARLPSNCHAITRLISSSPPSSSSPSTLMNSAPVPTITSLGQPTSPAPLASSSAAKAAAGESQVSQQRLGIALFLTGASS